MTCLALHGFAQTPDVWKKDQIIAPWLPGHGQMPLCEGHDFESAVREFVFQLHADHQPLTLIGYSMGARIALSIALLGLLDIQELILYSVHSGLSDAEKETRRAQEALWKTWLSDSLECFADRFAELPVLNAGQQHEQARAWRLSHTAQGLQWAIDRLGLVAMPDYRLRLSELSMPVTLVVGEYDHTYRAYAETMLPCLKYGTLRVMAGRGHDCVGR